MGLSPIDKKRGVRNIGHLSLFPAILPDQLFYVPLFIPDRFQLPDDILICVKVQLHDKFFCVVFIISFGGSLLRFRCLHDHASSIVLKSASSISATAIS